MRKFLLSLVGLATVWAALGWVANAQSLEISDLLSGATPKVEWAYAQLLTDFDSRWGYLDDATVTCNEENSTINIKSPKLYDEVYEVTKTYRLFVSPYRLSQLKNNDVVVNSSNIIMKEIFLDPNSDEITFSLWASDWIEANKAYYGFITPVNEFNYFGTPSKEVCFILWANQCMIGDACDNLAFFVSPTQEEHGAADDSHGANCVGMDMANVTHSRDEKNWTVTLKWTAIPDGDKVEISIFNETSEEYEEVKTVNMNDEQYTYTLQWSWEQNFLLTNGCGGWLRYKADAAMTAPEPEKEIVPPATWPAENILIIAVAAIVLYGLYTLFLRRPSN